MTTGGFGLCMVLVPRSENHIAVFVDIRDEKHYRYSCDCPVVCLGVM